MISDLSLISKLFNDEPSEGWFFNEVVLDKTAIGGFSNSLLDLEYFEHSARWKSSSNNYAYIPCQYFMYALKVRPLALMLNQYVSLKEEIEGSLPGNNKSKAAIFEKLIASSSPDNINTNTLDQYSRDNFFNFFKHSEKRLGSKSPVNSDRGVIRSDADIFGSAILKVLPVPDDSSNALGRLIFAFSKSPEIYNCLMNQYAHKLSYLFKSKSGDDLLYLIFVTLGLENSFKTVLSGLTEAARKCSIGKITDALLLNTTPVPGNSSYFDTPVHYSTSLKLYVFFKKGLLDNEDSREEISHYTSSFWPYAHIDKGEDGFYLKAVAKDSIHRVRGGFNRIIYGAPGTGKSHSIEDNTDENLIIRTVFHPDTQYSDFIGCLKPVMEEDRVSYRFRPGAFTEALVKAVNDPSKSYKLVIEEINRAPAAAVFGEIFQLLDRKPDGSSCYRIDISDIDLLAYLNMQTGGYFSDKKLSIPSNLSLLATMNSSDQAVMPLDTAFKRRWSFHYIKIDFSNKDVSDQTFRLMTSQGLVNISWRDFADKLINHHLKELNVPEDRLLGPFFLSETELSDEVSAKDALCGKLFVYLWDDVLRHRGRESIFARSIRTFGDLHEIFHGGSIPVFSEALDAQLIHYGELFGAGAEALEEAC